MDYLKIGNLGDGKVYIPLIRSYFMTDDEDTGEPEERKLPNIPWSAWEGQRGIPYFGTKGDDPFSEESQGQRLPKPIPEDFGIRIEPSTPRKEEYLRTLRVCADFPRTKQIFVVEFSSGSL